MSASDLHSKDLNGTPDDHVDSASPLVSCVIPTLDSEAFVAEALASVRDQTHRPIEIIVVDAGSSDSTVDIVRREAPNARIVVAEGTSPAAARNAGIGHARGSFVAFLDSDDRWHPRKLERQLRRFEANPDLDASVTLVETFWTEDLKREEDALQRTARGGAIPGYATTTLLARSATFDRFGVLDEDRWHTDAAEWFERVRNEGGIVELLPEVLLHRRIHVDALTRCSDDRSRIEWLDLLKAVLDRRRPAEAPLKRQSGP